MEEKEREQEVRCNFVMGVVGCKTLDEAKKQIEEVFQRENREDKIEFWESLELVEIIE